MAVKRSKFGDFDIHYPLRRLSLKTLLTVFYPHVRFTNFAIRNKDIVKTLQETLTVFYPHVKFKNSTIGNKDPVKTPRGCYSVLPYCEIQEYPNVR